jgi:hypothetical protein
MNNLDINRYARMASQAGGKTHTDHMLIVANPSLDAMHALFIYPSGPNGRAAPYLPPAAQLKDGKRKAASKSAVAAAKKRRSELVRNSVLLVGSLHPYASTQLETSEEALNLLNQQRLCYGQPRHVEVVVNLALLLITIYG